MKVEITLGEGIALCASVQEQNMIQASVLYADINAMGGCFIICHGIKRAAGRIGILRGAFGCVFYIAAFFGWGNYWRRSLNHIFIGFFGVELGIQGDSIALIIEMVAR